MIYKYKTIRLPDGTTRNEHRLVMEKHLGRRLSRHEVVHHINDDPRDNRLENLEVMSLGDHARLHLSGITLSEDRRADISRQGRGSRHSQAILDEADVVNIKFLLGKSGMSGAQIGRLFGVSKEVISKIKTGYKWRHVDCRW